MKLVKIAAVAAALAFGLAGCGSGDGDTTSNQSGKKSAGDGDKPAAITVWRFGDPTDPHKAFMDEVNAEFTKQTGVKVNVSWIAWPDVPDKLSAAAAGGEGPDVTEIGNTDVLTWAGQDALADITENVEAWDEAKGIPDNLWSYEKLDGATYAVPWLGGARVVYYRKDWFDELGIKTPSNWAELEAAAKRIVAAKGKGVAGFMRQAEQRILPGAADRGTAVMVNMPLEKARLHKVVEGRRLPGFAAEIGCSTWAQFFLKYVASHPAVTCVLAATTNPDHVAENVAAMRGPLPDRAMRARMVRHMESIPGFAELESMPWYPGKTFDGVVKL